MQQQPSEPNRQQSAQGNWYTRLPFNYGWAIAAVSGIGVFMSSPGQTHVVSIFVDPIIEETGWSRTLVSGLYSAGSISAIVGAVLAGRAFDRFGARISLTATAALFGLAAFLMGKITTPMQLFFGFFAIRSLGQTAMTLIPTSMVSIWFVRLRGRATAFTMLAGPAGQAAFPPILQAVISGSDWRSAWTLMGVAIWAVMLSLAIFLVRRTPESIGLLPDGDRSTGRTSTAGSSSTGQQQEEHWKLGEAVRTRSFWLIWIAGFPLSLIGTALTFHHISLMKSKGVDGDVAAGILSFMAIVALVGTFLGGWLLDRFPNRVVLAAGQALLAGAMLWTLMISSPWEGFVYGLLMGSAQGFVMTANVVIWPNYFGRRHLGAIRGAAAVGMVVSGGLGPLPFGYVFDLTNNYNIAVLGFIAMPIVCGMAALLATPPVRHRNAVPA
ncbi:MAG: MFS transporter [SAR202 cluster bacterium]|nr:MFS transporter [SAR202 cluster bacterium]